MKSKRSESTPPKESRQKIIPLTRCCVETLREQERPVDCGDTLGRFQRRGLARARAASHERIGGAGRYRRGGRAPRRRTAREGFRRRERFANEKKVSDEPKDYHRCTYLQGAPPAAWTAAGRRLAYSHNMSSAVHNGHLDFGCHRVPSKSYHLPWLHSDRGRSCHLAGCGEKKNQYCLRIFNTVEVVT